MKNRFSLNSIHLIIFGAAVVATFLPVVLYVVAIKQHSGGNFIYPVDDAYIHLQIAKNLVENGTWGINNGVFGSASSSILYTLILSASAVLFSVNNFLPLIINCIAALVLLVCIQQWLKQQVSFKATLLILLLVVFITPLPILIISGMEHVLQCLFTFLFLTRFSNWVQQNNNATPAKIPWQLYLFALLMVTIRYEGLFILFLSCVLLVFKKQWKQALLLGAVACLPVFIFGVYSVIMGSYFLPNSVMVKSVAGATGGSLFQTFENILLQKFTFAVSGVTLLATQKLLITLLLVFVLFYKRITNTQAFTSLTLLTGGVFLHLALADTGKFYRYEAYLILSGIIFGCGVLYQNAKYMAAERNFLFRAGTALILFFLLFPLVLRSVAAFSKAGQASVNIYEQQYQMARFVNTHYNNSVVAANDIGAVSFFSNARIFDVWGLADIEVAQSKKMGHWNSGFLDSLSREKKVEIGIVYDSWIGKSLPPNWIKVAAWKIKNNVVNGDDRVSFYAANRIEADNLRRSLRQFATSLPIGVTCLYY